MKKYTPPAPLVRGEYLPPGFIRQKYWVLSILFTLFTTMIHETVRSTIKSINIKYRILKAKVVFHFVNRYSLFIILYSILFLFSSCESVVDFPEISKENPVPVIEAFLTDRTESQSVRLSYSVPLNDSLSCEIIDHARVFVYSEENDTIFYRYESNGWYRSIPCAARLNKFYTLEVSIGEDTFRAKGKATESKGIDSAYYSYVNDSVYKIFVRLGKIKDKISYYYADIFKNNNLVNSGKDLFLVYDENIEKSVDLKIPYPYSKNDTFTIDIHSISKEMFDYYYQLIEQFFYTSYFNIGYKSNPVIMFEGRALGYFRVSSVYSSTLILKQ